MGTNEITLLCSGCSGAWIGASASECPFCRAKRAEAEVKRLERIIAAYQKIRDWDDHQSLRSHYTDEDWEAGMPEDLRKLEQELKAAKTEGDVP